MNETHKDVLSVMYVMDNSKLYQIVRIELEKCCKSNVDTYNPGAGNVFAVSSKL